MSYVDDIEIDFAVLLRVDDFWCRPADWILRFAGRLVAYRGSLWSAMERDAAAPAPAPVTGLSTAYPQAVDGSADDGDTPPDVVAALWHQAIVKDYQNKGFQVDGIEQISADEMRAMLDG
jgi:hypothetical protein